MRSHVRNATLALAILVGSLASTQLASAQGGMPAPVPMSAGMYYHYPFYYFPHNYWPTMGPQWPERAGEPYMRPPAYMAYPAFHEPHWRYELWKPRPYYRGFHFWLDQF